MQQIYLDNGATSYPKAPLVAKDMSDYILNIGTNVNRGAYALSYSAENTVYETRELICQLFNFNQAENVVFTKNVTESLNVLIKGLLKENDHVIVSSMEHNAVMRPLNFLGDKIEYSKVKANEFGELDPLDVKTAIKNNTKAVIMTHASNVCGSILDLEKIGQLCLENNIFFIIDSAQTAGFSDIDFQKLNADAIAFTGHKALLGPQGIGGFIVNDKLNNELKSLIQGGTGSLSDSEVQPDYMPDKFEAGTLNIPAIYGLNSSLKYILKYKTKNIRKKELELVGLFMNELKNTKEIRLIGKNNLIERTGVLSYDFINHDNGMIAHKLNKNYGIMTRSGLHCAPSAHMTLNTFPKGTVRFSVGHFNTEDEIIYTTRAIKELLNTKPRRLKFGV